MPSIQRTKLWPSDWPEAADVVFQSEPHVDHHRRDRARLAAESVKHIAALGMLAEQLLAERQYWCTVALEHGATFAEIAAAMAAGSAIAGPEPHRSETNWLARGVVAWPVCVDCGHSFHPDSSPDLERCWMCSERHEGDL